MTFLKRFLVVQFGREKTFIGRVSVRFKPERETHAEGVRVGMSVTTGRI